MEKVLTTTLVRRQTAYTVRVVETFYNPSSGDSCVTTSYHATAKMVIADAKELNRDEILVHFKMKRFNGSESQNEWSYRMDYFDPFTGWQPIRIITIP